MLFLGKLVLFSLLALPTVEWFASTYQGILLLGVRDIGDVPFVSARMLYLYFVLVLATPGISLRRRSLGIAGGLLLYLLMDRLMIPVWRALPYTQKPGPVAAKEFYKSVYYMLMHWLLPFFLWIVVGFRQIEEMCKGQRQDKVLSPVR